jgi:hypothetical protein
MSIENFKNPWVDEWKRGGKLHPDWLGGEKVLEVNEAVEFTNTANSILGLNSFGSNGFLNVRLNSGEIVSLAQYCKVDEVKFNHNKTREEFRILEWPFENKLASVSCERIGKSRFAAISYEPQAKIYCKSETRDFKYCLEVFI